MPDNPTPRRRWYQVSLRAWLLLALLLCVCFAWLRDHAEQLVQKAAIQNEVRLAIESAAISEAAGRMRVGRESFTAEAYLKGEGWWVTVWPKPNKPWAFLVIARDGSIKYYQPPESPPKVDMRIRELLNPGSDDTPVAAPASMP